MATMAPRFELYRFRYRDPRNGKWVRARYVATQEEIAARYREWEILGVAEVRDVEAETRYFNPETGPVLNRPNTAESSTVSQRSQSGSNSISGANAAPLLEDSIAIDDLERFLLLVFLRRYVTQCARSSRFAAMNGAARLYASVSGY